VRAAFRPALLLALVASPATFAASEAPPDVREGRWEYKTTVQIPGLVLPEGLPALPPGIELPEGMSMPRLGAEGVTSTITSCLTRDQLVPPTDQAGQECRILDLRRRGNTVTWKAECDTPQGKGRGEGQAVYSRERMNATMSMSGNFQGIPAMMELVTEGRYIGPCQ